MFYIYLQVADLLIANLPYPCCSWLHCLELLRQALKKDGNSGH